ncbi:hypothetical protein BD410DRAFT_895932 [Rickenella mellea]|uniref:Uncharacterized protein n=1 Tax=Rickenella mellea TaxID=50990 RepID=A0A4Y7QDL3_9AGAM|nr:hypothetical protein BD410DRAFT_895932 [Rickenella mellea]
MANQATTPPVDKELPGYSPQKPQATARAGQTEQAYSLETNAGRKWITLRVTSWSPNPKSLPLFLDGDTIKGTVEVDLEKPESSKGVSINISGEVTSVGQEPQPFLDLSSQLWTGSKLAAGKQSWPFSIALPKEVNASENPKSDKGKPYPLPPSFSERASAAYIDYKITVTVKRGAFKVNQTLSTSFAYVPRIRAPPPSALRLLAYSEGDHLVGPEGDPQGWKTLPPVTVKGTLFDTKGIEIECILAVATPISFATGSPIPLFLTLKCSDSQALDLLAAPAAPIIYLTRSVAIGSEAANDDAPRRSNNTFVENIGKAFFWPSTEGAPEEGVKKLSGELEVKKGTKPSFIFPRFSLRHYLTFDAPAAPGFVASTADQPVFTERISIVTENTPGVVPRSHAPPGYTHEDTGNYNNSVGYLENGNQRFYHHHPGF